jgi:hypothetical protein
MTRPNYRGHELAFPLGAATVASALVALAPLAPLDALADEGLLEPEFARWLTYVVGIAFLGLFDDVLGRGAAADTARGWRGHARAVLSGQLSTGAIKALGALALAAFVLARRDDGAQELERGGRPGADAEADGDQAEDLLRAPRSSSWAPSSRRSRSAPRTRCASARCSATRARTCSARSRVYGSSPASTKPAGSSPSA